jgi:hypothetical protein
MEEPFYGRSRLLVGSYERVTRSARLKGETAEVALLGLPSPMYSQKGMAFLQSWQESVSPEL